MLGLFKFLLGRDQFGHSLNVNYKGSETHQTKLGAFVSIMI